MLHLRKRGNVWYARGAIRICKESIHISEFSTGYRVKSDAEAYTGAYEAKIRADGLEGPERRKAKLTLDDCFAAYLPTWLEV